MNACSMALRVTTTGKNEYISWISVINWQPHFNLSRCLSYVLFLLLPSFLSSFLIFIFFLLRRSCKCTNEPQLHDFLSYYYFNAEQVFFCVFCHPDINIRSINQSICMLARHWFLFFLFFYLFFVFSSVLTALIKLRCTVIQMIEYYACLKAGNDKENLICIMVSR